MENNSSPILYFQIDLDGRDVNVEGYENGNFVGPTVISGVKVNECRETFILS